MQPNRTLIRREGAQPSQDHAAVKVSVEKEGDGERNGEAWKKRVVKEEYTNYIANTRKRPKQSST